MDLETVRKRGLRRRKRMRVGRGTSSGKGKTCGRGQKGQGARTGPRPVPYFEGGQLPIVRRLPKRGFRHARHGKRFAEIDLGDLENNFEEGSTVTVDEIRKKGIADPGPDGVRLLGSGTLTKPLTVRLQGVTRGAREAIEKAGGNVEVVPMQKGTEYVPIRLGTLNARFEEGAEVDPQALAAKGILRDGTQPVRIVKGGGALRKKLTIRAHRFSRTALEEIRRTGGRAVVLT